MFVLDGRWLWSLGSALTFGLGLGLGLGLRVRSMIQSVLHTGEEGSVEYLDSRGDENTEFDGLEGDDILKHDTKG